MSRITIHDLLDPRTAKKAGQSLLKAEAYGYGRDAVIEAKRRAWGDAAESVVRNIEKSFARDFSDLATADLKADPCFREYGSKLALTLNGVAGTSPTDEQRSWLCSLGCIALGIYWRWCPTIHSTTASFVGLDLYLKSNGVDEPTLAPTERQRFDFLRQNSPGLQDAFSLFDLWQRGCGPAVGGSKERPPLLRYLWRRHKGIPSTSIEICDDDSKDLPEEFSWGLVFTTDYISREGGSLKVAKEWHDMLSGRMVPKALDLCDDAACRLAITSDQDAVMLSRVLFAQYLFGVTREVFGKDGKAAARIVGSLMSIPYEYKIMT